jgi:hypothetical protein
MLAAGLSLDEGDQEEDHQGERNDQDGPRDPRVAS